MSIYAAGDVTTMCTPEVIDAVERTLASVMDNEASFSSTCEEGSVLYKITVTTPFLALEEATARMQTELATKEKATALLGNVAEGFSVLSTPLLDGKVLGSCFHWCNQYTCGKTGCLGCSVCTGIDIKSHCAWWCNVYACYAPGDFCTGCDVCASLQGGTHCATWCNWWTCWVRGGFCDGCYSCGGVTATISPFATPCSTSEFSTPCST